MSKDSDTGTGFGAMPNHIFSLCVIALNTENVTIYQLVVSSFRGLVKRKNILVERRKF
jgi:hypothetical protein